MGVVGKWERDVEKVWKSVWAPHTFPHLNTFFTLFSHPSHSPHTLLYTFSHTSTHISPQFLTPPHLSPHLPLTSDTSPTPPLTSPTPSIFPPFLFLLPKLPKIPQFSHHPYSSKFFILLHTPHSFPDSPTPILAHTYFIIYPIPKFFTFLIYCQFSLAIKYYKNSL